MNAPHDDQPAFRPWLHRFACVLAAATFVLVTSGGNVTSHEAAEAVPDGFTVYGHFLWTFPYDMWVGNIYHEHVHRLKGSVIGLLTIALAIWLYCTQAHRPRMRLFGLLLLLLVLVQGAMGGLRVEFVNHFPRGVIPFAMAHAVTGQVFLALTVIAAAMVSSWWLRRERMTPAALLTPAVRRAGALLLGAVFVQLILGAALRHNDAALAIPDFPTSYGRLLPPMHQAQLDAALAELPYDQATVPYSIMQVHLQFAHRLWALAVLAALGWLLYKLTPLFAADGSVARLLRTPALLVALLMAVQVILGASVIWTGRIPHVATAHQSVGALILALCTLLTLRLYALPGAPSPAQTATARQSASMEGAPA